ncbi:hypothetical protein OL548_27285 [Lysinibacillus sp. MHQ-1]|nr:hypothetical protein OL548_27285 [Lysinibacillus sp. MHQ-1]
MLNRALTQIPQVEQLTTNGLTTIQKGLNLVNEADALFNELSPLIKKGCTNCSKYCAALHRYDKQAQ